MNPGRQPAQDTRTAHQIAIDNLIPVALAEARAKVRKTGKSYEFKLHKGQDYNHCLKSQYYHEAMTRLTIAAGLRCQ